ncbi:hypothetical protein N1I86_10340 [Bacillus sp. FSL W8-0116]|uniref:hypothetical protein n=1 Tax=Bacillus sp. FSL W8-0116 TaxID=2978206 RepID=UPI0030FC3245
MKIKKKLDFRVKQLGQEDNRILRFIGSNEARDRDGDIILASGWELDNYKKNPVFLWAHDYTIPPIGRALSVEVIKNQLIFDIEFPEKGVYSYYGYFSPDSLVIFSISFFISSKLSLVILGIFPFSFPNIRRISFWISFIFSLVIHAIFPFLHKGASIRSFEIVRKCSTIAVLLNPSRSIWYQYLSFSLWVVSGTT